VTYRNIEVRPPVGETLVDSNSLRRALAPTLSMTRTMPEGPAAAVAAIFRSGPSGLEVLFIKRSERLGDPWSGHMAFPGGRRDPVDRDLLATALRETDEEIGLDLSRAGELVGVLEDQDATGRGTKAPLPTRPFVFELTSAPTLTLNPEVTEVIWAPVAPLVGGELSTTVHIDYKGQPYDLPGWNIEGRVVWGLTYRMTSTLLAKLTR
jgi:8-oxo-dGTP pyrophosphatase MutT (NUDIX family)